VPGRWPQGLAAFTMACVNVSLLHRAAFVACCVIFTNTAHAHDTWLAPKQFHVERPAEVVLTVSSGMEFPNLDHAIKPDRVALARQRTGAGDTADLTNRFEAAHALELRGRAAEGVTTFWTVLHPRPSEIKPEQVVEYVEHLGLADPAAATGAWERSGRAAVKYRYIKYAKSFTRAGTGMMDARAWAPVGMRLELVPETDPTHAKAGGSIRFVLLDRGKPLARYPVALVSEGKAKSFVTDAKGRVSIDIAKAGAHMLRATTLVDSAEPETRWDVHFATLTFFVSDV
jgi:uncharacterized GH25 family protein